MQRLRASLDRTLDSRRGGRALSMVASSMGLISGKAVLLGLGFFFWLFAARVTAASEVGLTGGVISAVMLCTQIAVLGVGPAFIGKYPAHRHHPHRLLDSALTIVGIAGLVVGVLFLLLAKGVFKELNLVESVPTYGLLFLGMCVIGTVGALLDPVSMAQGRGDQILERNVANGFLTIAPLAVFLLLGISPDSMWLFACWVAGSLSACTLGIIQLRGTSGYRYRPRVDPSLARALVAKGIPNQALGVAERAPGLILAILVTELLSPADNAYWYTVWMMAWGAYMIPLSVSVALFAEASHRPEELPRRTRSALRSSLAIGGPVAGVMMVAAGPLLSLLGPEYAAHGTTPLRILCFGVVPLAFFHAYVAVCRARDRLREAVLTAVISTVLALVASAQAGLAWGLPGIAACWVAGQCVTGLWSAWRLRVIFDQSPPERLSAVAPGALDDLPTGGLPVEVTTP